jgi:hypothetical protein
MTTSGDDRGQKANGDADGAVQPDPRTCPIDDLLESTCDTSDAGGEVGCLVGPVANIYWIEDHMTGWE